MAKKVKKTHNVIVGETPEARYACWLLKGSRGTVPEVLEPAAVDRAKAWHEECEKLLADAKRFRNAGESRGGLAFDDLKKRGLKLGREYFTGPDIGIVFGMAAAIFDAVENFKLESLKSVVVKQSPSAKGKPVVLVPLEKISAGFKGRTLLPYPFVPKPEYALLMEVQCYASWDGEEGQVKLQSLCDEYLAKYPLHESVLDVARANGKLLQDVKNAAYRLGGHEGGDVTLEQILSDTGISQCAAWQLQKIHKAFERGREARSRALAARKMGAVLRQQQNPTDKKKTVAQRKTVPLCSTSGVGKSKTVDLAISASTPAIDPAPGINPNSILGLKPARKWTIVADETGTEFANQAFNGGRAAGRYVFVLVPDYAQLPKLTTGWHAVNRSLEDLLSVGKALRDSGCGVIGIPVAGLYPTNRDLWLSCVETLLSLTLRLLPIDGETHIELAVERRGANDAKQNMFLGHMLDGAMYRLSLADPRRARQIHVKGEFIAKNKNPYNGYADLVAYSWGCGKEIKAVLSEFGWQESCLVSDEPEVVRAFHRCLELVKRGQALPMADWNVMMSCGNASAVGSLVGAFLRTFGEMARQDAKLWKVYLDYVTLHLDSKAIRMNLLVPQINWLKEYEPDGEQLPPRLRLLWLTAQLAVSNHQGGVRFGEVEHRQEFAGLMMSLKDEDAPLTCFAALHRAVELTDAFRFEEARELLQPWERESIAVPGLRYHAQVLSSLGQHEAFLGDNDKALDYFDKALVAFSRLSEDQQREIDHTLAYAVIAAMDAQSPRLPLLMAAYLYGGAYTVGGMVDMANQFASVGEDEPDSKYAHAIFLRYLVTLPEDDPVRKAYLAKSSEWKWSEDGHPWELIAFYRAILCADKPSRIRYLKQAFSLANQGGPTLQIIATAILGALLAEGEADAATYSAKVESVIVQLPALGADRIIALREQATNPQPGLLLAAKVLPFNFR